MCIVVLDPRRQRIVLAFVTVLYYQGLGGALAAMARFDGESPVNQDELCGRLRMGRRDQAGAFKR